MSDVTELYKRRHELAIQLRAANELIAVHAATIAELAGLVKQAEPYLRTFLPDVQIEAALAKVSKDK